MEDADTAPLLPGEKSEGGHLNAVLAVARQSWPSLFVIFSTFVFLFVLYPGILSMLACHQSTPNAKAVSILVY